MKTIELLLLDNVDNLGIIGDVVKVKPGYARNYLLPHGLADAPTPEKVEELAARRAEVQKELELLAKEQQKLIDKLEDYELTIERSANDSGLLYGGVSQHDIAEALVAEGFAIEDRHVRIGEQIKRLDSYDIPIVINKDLKTEIKLWVVSDRPLEDEPQEDAEATAEMEVVPQVPEGEAAESK
jgi:large subunit ribosomal protein L9